jgi:hypothetical protein
MQRLKIYTLAGGDAAFGGLTPEALNVYGERAAGPASVDILDSPADLDSQPSDRRELMIVLSGVYEFAAEDETRRLFPGDIMVVDGAEGGRHGVRAIGKESAIVMRFPLNPPD